MASMSYSGVLLANAAKQQNQDEYEEDSDLDVDEDLPEDERALLKRKKKSNVLFKPFDEWRDVKEWNYEMPSGESIECLAQGSGWCAVTTSLNNLRIFS